jgi:hypothetical protein
MPVFSDDQHVAAVGDMQRLARVLFDHQNRDACFTHFEYAIEKLVHDDRRNPRGWFVQHQYLGLRHQGTRDRDLLTLTAGELAGELSSFLRQDRKQLVDLLDRRANIVIAQEGSHFQVFVNRHAGEHVVGLRHEGDAFGDPVLRRQSGNILAAKPDFALFQVEHAEQRLHRGRFASAVGPDDDRDFAFVDLDGAALEDIGAAVPADHIDATEKTHPAASLFLRPRPR